jgi:hypothetical protein
MAETSGAGNRRLRLIFFRHFQYLRVPYGYDHPDARWARNPEELQTDNAWCSLIRNRHIPCVVGAPDYPESLSLVLEHLESEAFSSLLLPQKW